MTVSVYGSKKSATSTVAKVYEGTGNPYSAMIEIADRCNEVCVHCYQVQGQKGEMSTDEVKSVLDQLAELGVLFLVISGGEATLRSDFLEIVKYARKLKFAVKIYTNGLRITEELARELSALAVQEVQISLYSHLATVHDEVTGVPGSFTRTIKAIRHLRAAGMPVVMKTPLMKGNVAGYQEWIALAQSLGVDFTLSPHLNGKESGGREPEALRMTEEAELGIERNPILRRVAAGVAPPAVGLDKSPCKACSGNVHIEANGEMRPCTHMTVPVGHALRDGVSAAWDHNDEALFIRSLSWGDIHGCRDCDLRPHCWRCYADAGREGGDALAPYESACRRARLNYELAFEHAPTIEPGEGRRTATTGPYRTTASGCFESVPDALTVQDHELRRAHRWISTSPSSAQDGQKRALVQLRVIG